MFIKKLLHIENNGKFFLSTQKYFILFHLKMTYRSWILSCNVQSIKIE